MRFFTRLNSIIALSGALLVAAACNNTQTITNRTTANTNSTNTANINVANLNAAPAATNQAQDGVRRITIKEAQDLVARNQAIVVDVRAPEAFTEGHIKGAKLIPLGEIAARANELPKDKTIITYCA